MRKNFNLKQLYLKNQVTETPKVGLKFKIFVRTLILAYFWASHFIQEILKRANCLGTDLPPPPSRQKFAESNSVKYFLQSKNCISVLKKLHIGLTVALIIFRWRLTESTGWTIVLGRSFHHNFGVKKVLISCHHTIEVKRRLEFTALWITNVKTREGHTRHKGMEYQV